MSWGYCGQDSQGRDIGYSIPAICDHPGCDAEIDRGLSYACGGFHGEDIYNCEKYFCSKHRHFWESPDGDLMELCDECYGLAIVQEEDIKTESEHKRNSGRLY